MGFTETTELANWIVGVFLVSLISLITGAISIYKSGKLVSREVHGADLNNQEKEISIANRYDELASKAADKVLKTQERLDALEEEYKKLNIKLLEQEAIIKEQSKIIEEQNKRQDIQEEKIQEQQEEIFLLKCELENARSYNTALIKQMQEKNIIPIDESSTIVVDCVQIQKKQALKKKLSKDKKERIDGV